MFEDLTALQLAALATATAVVGMTVAGLAGAWLVERMRALR